MEAEAGVAAQGACDSLLALAQEGDAVEVRAQELCSVDLGLGLDHVCQGLAGNQMLVSGDSLLAAGSASVAAAGAELRPHEVGRGEAVLAESQLGDHEKPEVQQSASMAELLEEEQGPQSALVSGEQFVAEGADLIHVVQVWAEDESLGSEAKVWLDLHVGRQEEVLAEGSLVEGEEDEVPGQPEAAGEWDQEQGVQGQWAAWEESVLERAGFRVQGQALEALQLEMEPVNEQARRAFSRLQQRNWQRRKPHLELRSSIIQSLRGFWAKAFVNHPELSAMISEQDESMLSFMTDLKVENGSDRCKIMLLFRRNPYFCNDVIVKEYLITLTGYRSCYSTPIQWHKRYEREAYRRKHNNSSLNFFNWFSEHSLAGSGRIAECICGDLWSNPLKYYRKKMAAVEGSEERTGEESLAGYWAEV
ncbi:testis-specific Y-encoded protein 2-like [Artibeus jamaicensis]|uniref:testis-specific Y-encoded protein 2-like n=1 Tax=Artibeus jamaicensis TaxID=9417 RepID=UPI00235A7B8F|nr:testis-specific Y-encoded protein 2-like [Artibeus jamaicensis]